MPGLISSKHPSVRSADTASILVHKSCTLPRRGTLTAPLVNRVPVEILGEIFMICLQNDYVEFPEPSHLSATPLILSQVCSHWNDVTLLFPTLWSSIEVHYPRRRHVPMVKLWLDRSGTCPLSLTLGQCPDLSPKQHKLTDEILSLFLLHVSRWHEIDFKLYEMVQGPLLAIPEGAAKSLESAILDLESCGRDSADKIWRAIHASPSLRRANWWLSYGCVGMPVHIPWPQLIHITLHPNLTVDELLGILRLCQRVKVLEAYSITASSIPSLQAPLVVPNLHTMMICVRAHSGTFLDQLILPSIRSLDIRHHGSFVPRNPHSLHNLLVRSSCNLKKLNLYDDVIAEEDLLLYLKSPALVELVDLGLIASVTDTTMTSLTCRVVGGNAECLLPNLESISLKTCCTSDGVVSAMVASRLMPVPSLKTVTLRFRSTLEYDFAALRKMREAGLIVRAYSPTSKV